MNLRTEINPKFLFRMGMIALFGIGMTLYCLYDGLVAWPAQSKQAHAFLEFKEKEENSELKVMELFEKWKGVAAEQDWPAGNAAGEQTPYGPPKKPYDINGQFYMAAVTGFFGLFFLAKLLRNLGCWIEADDEGMHSSEGRELKFSQVTALNKKKWDNKGIAHVLYEADGQKNKIVLDDCNYDRDTTQTILRHVEATIGHDKIINGKPEKPLVKPEVDHGSTEDTEKEELG